MEHSPANQLPEADSLPDGFVESSMDPPSSILVETEKHQEPLDYKVSTLLELGHSSSVDCSTVDLPPPEHECPYPVGSDGIHLSGNKEAAEKTEKPRTFPVTLFEKDSVEMDGNLVVNDESVTPEVDRNPPEGLMRMSSPSTEFTVNSSCGHKDVEEETRNPEQRSTEGCLEQQGITSEERPGPGTAVCQKNRKLVNTCWNQEVLMQQNCNRSASECLHLRVGSTFQQLIQESSSEVKRKPVKRSVKSEKELLEFTLKYQKVIAERDAAIAVRDKLESLCRELQRQNKMLMDECKRVSTEGQNMRSDLSTKFHDAIKDVNNKLEEQKDECLSQLKENETLRNKLKHLADQYAVSEQKFQQKLKQKMLELQLADLKIQQHQEKSVQEQTQMQLYAEQVSQLLATEKNLRLQLQADGEKFQQFQDALLKSNEVFEAFKKEMEKMAKSIKDLTKENIFLKSKCEKTDVSLIELVEELEHLKKQLEKMKNQKEKLQSLCRSLQAERKQNPVGCNHTSESLPTEVRVGSTEEECS
ncbi:uncharacterized protein LOC131243378 isoform X1 [Magnolia sinica]|uniref:uncharacterized protein LOC131243378 isoform X1 n=1 Tax=Magnolia sinica TaxID=86752 RepID=UPI00265A76FC|nr:uncharacterized protein LOC131243378 isoform X1 [Magnolia sinica]